MTQSQSMPSVTAAGPLATAPWRTSSRSQTSNCVEFAPLADGPVAAALRDSKDRTGPVLLFDRTSWTDFIAGARSGRFDLG
jgi:hypothetical protein